MLPKDLAPETAMKAPGVDGKMAWFGVGVVDECKTSPIPWYSPPTMPVKQ